MEYITKELHEEFSKRIDEENRRQNNRIGELEKMVQQIHALTTSIEKMATNMESMLVEQQKQGERLEALEKEPAEAHKQIKMAIVTSIISAVIGAVVGAVLVLL